MRWIALLLAAIALVACATPPALPTVARAGEEVDDARVDAALVRAGPNRAEIERYLARYESGSDPESRFAARWLVANMPGHGFAKMALKRKDGSVVPFEATDHPNLVAAQAALDDLATREGSLSFGLDAFTEDLRVISADELIANHEQAFASWRTAPWSSSISFPTFLEHILPYRASNEPLDLSWRAQAKERLVASLADLQHDLGRDPTLAEATRAALKASKKWVKFRQLYYLHPTDQSWGEMLLSKAGRCEDQTNVSIFAARSIATVVAGDFTPYWADRDNNHAWDVVLDEHGIGSARLAHRPAKVYRKTFSAQPGSLGSLRRPGDRVPGGIAEPGLLDVTRQYVDTSDVTIRVGVPPADQRFAYLCVFNGGAWRPVHHALVEGGTARFTDMGRGVLYLPAWLGAEGIVGAANPFLLGADGTRTELAPVGRRERIDLPAEYAACELLVWSAGESDWRPVGTPDAQGEIELDPGMLYLKTDATGRGLERPFTVEGASIRRW